MSPAPPSLAVIVPTLDEEELLGGLLDDLSGLSAEVVVADGGSRDGTRAVARDRGARVIRAGRGRARQLRAGVAATDAAWLLVLHADSHLDARAIDAVRRHVDSASDRDFGYLRFRLSGSGALLRFIEVGQTIRERLTGLVYGDQGLLVSRALYDRAGGFPDWPLMEDVGIVDRLRSVGRAVRLPAEIVTSARRYREEGPIRGWLRNLTLISLFRLGVPPRRLAPWYRPHPGAEPSPNRHASSGDVPDAIIVFAKAPTPGRVKTRLARDVGDDLATRIYRTLGRTTVDALRGGPFRVIVYVDPPEDTALEEVRRWLDAPDVDYRMQTAGDLGHRMATAIDETLGEAERVCVVGTDIPGIDLETLSEAFDRLDGADVVLGPATDGGYYLIGMARAHPELFREVAWSTDAVLSTTLDRARSSTLSVDLLGPLTDVDTLSDVPEDLLAG